MNKPIRTGIAGQIIGSFEDIGEKIVEEVKKVPGDLTGVALENLGAGSSKKGGKQTKTPSGKTGGKDKTVAEQIKEAKNQQIQQSVARSALEQLAGNQPKTKEPGIWDQMQQEIEQKNQQKAAQAKATAFSQIPKTGSRPRRGNLMGITKQKSGSESGKNVRGD